MPPQVDAAIDLYWLPLGAGGHSVRVNGKNLRSGRRVARPSRSLRPLPLRPPGVRARGTIRDRAGTGVGRRRPRRHYQGRRRNTRGPTFPALPLRDPALARRGHPGRRRGGREPSPPERRSRLRASAARAGAAGANARIGIDELGAGEMWNSNSTISWLLARTGLDVEAIQPPARGRAPGWQAGIVIARRPHT